MTPGTQVGIVPGGLVNYNTLGTLVEPTGICYRCRNSKCKLWLAKGSDGRTLTDVSECQMREANGFDTTRRVP